MSFDYRTLRTQAKDYVMIVVGLALYSFGFTAFILPEKVVIGGVAGLASLIYFGSEQFIGYGIPAFTDTATWSFVCSMRLRMSDNTLFMPSLEIFSIIRSQKGVDYILVANIVISRQQAKTSGKQFGIWKPPPLQKKRATMDAPNFVV